MARILSIAAAALIAFSSADASACEAGSECKCKHEAGEGKAEGSKKAKKKAAASVDKATEKKEAPAAAPPEPAKEGSILREVDEAIAGKCSCASAADCTCKKGECKCPKCKGLKRHPVYESLKGSIDPLKIPQNAREDARAGIFI